MTRLGMRIGESFCIEDDQDHKAAVKLEMKQTKKI
jgi:hypothetical protein